MALQEIVWVFTYVPSGQGFRSTQARPRCCSGAAAQLRPPPSPSGGLRSGQAWTVTALAGRASRGSPRHTPAGLPCKVAAPCPDQTPVAALHNRGQLTTSRRERKSLPVREPIHLVPLTQGDAQSRRCLSKLKPCASRSFLGRMKASCLK